MVDSITSFFESFEMDSDLREGHYYKAYVKSAILEFLQLSGKDNAFIVYNTFFDCYRVKLQGNKNFIDLVDTLKNYEENASVLIDKQRDHYVHSVNVFALGLYIYQSNKNFRDYFESYYRQNSFSGILSTHTEEFFFQWGIASLFHDIGYPVEITNNQLKKFIKFVVEADKKEDAKPYIDYMNFNELSHIPIDIEKIKRFCNLAPGNFDASNSIDLLSYSIHKTFDIEYLKVKEELDAFLEKMQKFGFVDHGFYSAIIVLRWYGYLVEKSELEPDVFYNSILNAASAILLHNYYKNCLQESPFNLKQMSARNHPLAYMMILCDGLQEWNREAYGVLDKQRVLASDSKITIDEECLSVHYITYKGTLSEDFAPKKEEMFKTLLNFEEIFKKSIKITCTTRTELYIEEIKGKESALLPRPIIENIEQLARTIHKQYNKKQLEADPHKPLEYPDWDSLTDSLKYSNIRQARAYFDKLRKVGYIALTNGTGKEEVEAFSGEQAEMLARDEHDSWYEERKQNGWVYGDVKDAMKKISPYMIPYDQLSEKIKKLDRDAVENIFPLLHSIGLKIYKV